MDLLIETKFAYYRIGNNIVFLQVKFVTLNLEAAEAITEQRLILQSDKSFLVLLDLNTILESDKDGRDYLAHYGCLLTKGMGIVVHTHVGLTIANFFVIRSKPIVATKIFNDEISALNYLINQ